MIKPQSLINPFVAIIRGNFLSRLQTDVQTCSQVLTVQVQVLASQVQVQVQVLNLRVQVQVRDSMSQPVFL